MTRRFEVNSVAPAILRYTTVATRDPTIAILNELAPKVLTPPSPKNIAWIKRAMEMEIIEAQGPRTTEAIPTPMACAVVPPGRGMLNIITTNEKAAKTERIGVNLVLSIARTRRRATYQKGAAPAYRATQETPLRYPSGIRKI